jgi:hypothetical protein
MGFSRSKSCKLIGFDESTLSKWARADESLSMKLEGWENTINTVAMQNIFAAIQKESELDDDLRKDNTKWWLERKMKAEFSTRQEQTGPDGKEMPAPIIKLTRNNVSGDDSTE